MAEEFLKVRPWVLVGALVVLPFFPVPVSALLVLAGVVWRQQPVMACGIALGAMTLNMALGYWVAARPGRGIVEKFLAGWKVSVPVVPPGQDLKLVVLLRLTPGLPFFIQNYTLGFLRVPFRMFLPVSFFCVALPMAGMVLGGAGMASGSWMPFVAGAGLLVAGFVGVRFARSALGGKTKGTAPRQEG